MPEQPRVRAKLAAILSTVAWMFGLLAPYLFPTEEYGPLVRKWVAPVFVIAGVAVFVVVAVWTRRAWLEFLKSKWGTLSVPYYNWRTRRRIRHITGQVLTLGHSPLLREIDPRAHDAHEGKRPIPYESFFYCPARLRHDVPPGQHGNRLDHMRPTNDGGLAGLGASAVEGDGSKRCRIYGPYAKLPRPGIYVVSFRVRCRNMIGGQAVMGCEIEADITHHKGTLFPGPFPVRVTLSPSDYVAMALLFAYRGEPEVEFRLRAQGDPAAAVVIDTVCVLRIGDAKAATC